MFTSHEPVDPTDAARRRLHSGITVLAIACTLFGIVLACRATEYSRCRIAVRARPIERQQRANEGRVWWRRRSLEQCMQASRRGAGNRGNGRGAAGMHSAADLEGGAEMSPLPSPSPPPSTRQPGPPPQPQPPCARCLGSLCTSAREWLASTVSAAAAAARESTLGSSSQPQLHQQCQPSILPLTEERCRSTPSDIARPQPVHTASSESQPTKPKPARETVPEVIAGAKPKPWPTYSLFPRIDNYPGPTTIAAPPCVYIAG